MATGLPDDRDRRSLRRRGPSVRRNAASSILAGLLLLLTAAAAPVFAAADLVIDSVTHTPASPTAVVAGSTTDLVFTVSASNHGTMGADGDTGSTLSLPLAGTGLLYQSTTFALGCSVVATPTSHLECDLGAFTPSQARNGTINFRVAASVPAGSPTATFSLVGEVDTTADTEGEDYDVAVEADLTVDKSAPTPTNEAVPGTTITYSVSVANAGPSDATNVVLADPGPTGFGSPTFAGDCVGATCSLGTIAPGASRSVTVAFSIPDDYHLVNGTADVTNTATATTDTPDAGASDYADSVTTPVVPKVDLTVAISNGASSVAAGGVVSYTVTVDKTGPSRLAGVHLTSNVDLTKILSQVVTTAEGTFAASTVSPNWFGLDLAGVDSASLTLTGWLSPAVSGTFAPTLTVAPPAGVTDTNGTNNSGSDSDPVTRSADLRITKTNSLDGVAPGQLVPYTIRVSNAGPADVPVAAVSDPFPAQIDTANFTCGPSRELTEIQQLVDGDASVDGLDGVSGLAVSPDGLHVYAAAAADNSIAWFGRSGPAGDLAYVGRLVDGPALGLAGATAVALAPGGGQAYVAGFTDSALQVLTRNPATGALTALEVHQNGVAGVTGLSGPRAVAVAPDGRHVYVAAATSGTVAVFARNLATGALTFVTSIANGGGVSGLTGARDVAVAPDGRNVVVAGEGSNALAYFARSPVTGALTFVTALVDGTAGGDGLGGASGVAFAPTGAALYAVGHSDNSVVAFSRNLSTGALTWLEAEVQGVAGVTGLAGPRSVRISPDGNLAFVMSETAGGVATFTRNQTPGPQTHTLEFVAAITASSAVAGAMSPAGEQLYVAAPAVDRLTGFSETYGASCPATGGPITTLTQNVNLPAQSYVTFVVQAHVSASATGTLTNTASVSATGIVDATTPLPAGICLPADTSNNQCSDSDEVGLQADLSITKTASPASAVPGQGLTYTLTVANAGADGVSGVAIADTDLSAADFASVTWTCSGTGGAVCGATQSGTGNISVSDVVLPAGGQVVYTITTTLAANAAGTACDPPLSGSCVKNSATATLPPTHLDPTPNGPASVQTPIVRQAEVSVTKAVATPLADIDAGAPLAYTITARNCGPSDVTGAIVQDLFPADFENVTWTCAATNGTCAPSGSGNLSESVDLEAGDPGDCANAGMAIFTVTGNVVASPSAGTLANTAKILLSAGFVDPVTGNNTSSVLVGLQAVADIAIVKSDGGASTAVPGDPITYSIAVLNYGPDDATQLEVEDLFPPALRNVSWTCSSESPPKGTLTFLEEQRDGQDLGGGVLLDGLSAVRAVAVAPDSDGPGPDPGGKFVYATGYSDDAVARFLRDASTGALTFLDKVADGSTLGSSPVDGLDGASGLVISPDGLNLYVVGEVDDKLASFSRNLTSGALGVVGTLMTQGVSGVDGLDGARDLTISPDGKHLYVTSPLQGSIAVFARNTALSGSLSFVQVLKMGTIAALAGARGVAVSPDGASVYVAADGAGADAILFFRRDADPMSATFGRLTHVATHADGGTGGGFLDGASDVALSPGGDFLYATAAADEAVSIFSRVVAAGPTQGQLTYVSELHDGAGAIDLEGANSIAVSPDGQHAYVASLVSEAVVVFQRNTATGGLKFVDGRSDGESGPCVQPTVCNVQSLGGAGTLALDPSGANVYVTGYLDSALSVFRRDGAPPAFAFGGGRPGVDPPEPVRDGIDGVTGLDGVTDLALAGSHLYAVSFEDASVVAFTRDAISGELDFVQRLTDGAGANGLAGASAVAAFDQNVYVVSQSVNQAENALVTFTRDPGTGALTFLGLHRDGQGGVSGMFGASDVVVSADGANVYVAGRTPGSIARFSRNPTTGALAFQQSLIANQGGVVGIQGASALALSSDGRHLYVAASVDDGVAVFSRDPSTGALAEIQALSGLVKLDRALGIAVSHEAGGTRNVYVTGHTANSLVVFARNADETSPDFGRLTVLESFTDGAAGVDGLAGARAVEVSPDGKQVYVAGENDDALAAFAREEGGGHLVFVEARVDGEDGVDGIDQAFSVVVSANNRNAYVAGFGEDAIALFRRASGSRCTGAGAGTLLDTGVEIAAGGQVVYTVHATIDPAATGELVNEAYVTVPVSLTQPTDPPSNVHPPNVCVDNVSATYGDILTNDGCRDIDVLTPKGDLAVDKSDGDNVAVPGAEITYTVVVENEGPSNVVDATVNDVLTNVFPDGASWTCVAEPSGSLSFTAAAFDGVDGADGLQGAAGVAVSPDGRQIYVAGRGEDVLAVYSVDDTSGALALVEVHRDGIAGVEGLDGATAVTLSPDGANVYVASRIDDAVAVFARDGVTGALTFVEVQQSPFVAGLDGPVDLAFDAAGESLYVAASNSSSVTVFDRNPATGELTFLEIQQDGVGGVTGLAGASSVAVSADGMHVYVAAENSSAVSVFARDAGTGALTWVQTKSDGVGGADGLAGARWVRLSPDDEAVYVAGAAESAIAVFSRDPVLGTLTFRQAVRDGVGGVNGLAGVSAFAISDDDDFGFHLYAAGTAEGAIAVFRRDASDFGRLTFFTLERDGFGGVDGLDGVAAVAISGDGRRVFAAGAGEDAVAEFARPTDSNCSSGADFTGPDIELVDVVDIAAGSRIVYEVTGVVDADLCTSYPCAPHLVNTVTVTNPLGNEDPDLTNNGDTDDDALSPRGNLRITKTDNVSVLQGLAGASAVAISPDGENAYATGLVGDGVLAFTRDPVTGSLTFLHAVRDGVAGVDGLNGASAVKVSPDGRHVYVAGSADNALVVFERSVDDGRLVFVEKHQNGFAGVSGLLGPAGIAIPADGANVYVASANSSAVAIFGREDDEASPSFGRLTYVGQVRDGIGGVDGLALARAVAVSSDLKHVYAVGESDNSLAVFARADGSGLLTFVERETDGVAGVSGIAGPRGVAVSPDGLHVYVSGGSSNAVALFARVADTGSPDFGKVSFVAAWTDGVAGVDGLQGATGIVVAPDPPGGDPGGQHVYVTGRAENAVATFARDAVTGSLTFVEAAHQGQGGFDGLGAASAVAVAPDGRHVYVTGADPGAVVTTLRDWDGGTLSGSGALAFVEADHDGDGTASPGQVLHYEIVVTNDGPSTVFGATVTDIFPGELEDVTWTCTTLTPGAACLGGAAGTGDLVRTVRLPPGGSVLYDAIGTIKPGVTGAITNTATVHEPSGFIDLVPGDNSATDGDTVLARRADLTVEKIACDDPLDCAGTATAELVPGTRVHYEIRVENQGPADVQGAVVDDALSELFSNAAWSCVAEPVPGLLAALAPTGAIFDGDDVDDVQPACGPLLPLVNGLDGARAVAIAPDGLNVYVAGGVDHAVVSFRRDLRNGGLRFVGVLVDGQPRYDVSCAPVGLVDGLRGAAGVATSPDGLHVYVAAELDDAVSAFRRDAATGALAFLEFKRDGVAGVNGLGNARGVAVSPDGKHVYTAARSDNGVGVFARNAGSGLLTYQSIVVDGMAQAPLTVDGLAGAVAVALSPDGTSLYATGEIDDAVAVFKRNSTTGALTFVEAKKNGLGGVSGLDGARAVAVSGDGLHVYVASALSDAVAVFSRNPSTGALAFVEAEVEAVGGASGLDGASGVLVSADGENVYVTGESGGTVAVFARDPLSGALTPLDGVADGADGVDGIGGARGLALSPDDEQVYVAGDADDALALLARGSGSRCTPAGFGDIHDTVDVTSGGSLVYSLAADLSAATDTAVENLAVVTAPGDVTEIVPGDNDSLHVATLLPTVDLVVEKTDFATEAVPGSEITYTITVTNAGPSDLVGAALEDLLPAALGDAQWSCLATGALAPVETETQGAGGVTGLDQPVRLAVAPDPDGVFGPAAGGLHVYVASRASQAIDVFARDPLTGELDFVASYVDGAGGFDGFGGSGGVAISPDGLQVYATGRVDDAVAVLARNPTTGVLTPVAVVRDTDPGVDGLDGASIVTVSRDGKHVYVGGEDDDAIAVFSRDAGTGALTYVTRYKDGFGGLPFGTLDRPTSVVVTADGRHLLVAASDGNAISIFARSAATGLLTLVQHVVDGEGGVEGLALVQSVAVSSRGQFVYAASLADDAISVFARDAVTGLLTFVGESREGVGGVTGLDGVRAIAVSPDGIFLFAASYNSDAVVVFRRNATTGLLTELQVAHDGVGGFAGLDGARALALDPTGRDLYVLGEHADAVAALTRVGQAQCAGGGAGDVASTLDLAVGATATFTLQATIDPAAVGTLDNTVTVAVPVDTVNNGADSATDSDLLTPVADLAISKTDGVTSVSPGTTTIYLIVATNDGPSDAPASVVEDTLPPEVAAATWTCEGADGGLCVPSGTGSISEAVDLPVGASVVFAMAAEIDGGATGSVTNVATVAPAAGVADLAPANNSATDVDTLAAEADLVLSMTADQSVLESGEPIVFEIQLSNLGPAMASGISLTDILPTGLVVDAVVAPGWSCTSSSGSFACTIAGVDSGNAAPVVTVEATVPATPGAYVNAATVVSTSSDPVSGNNTAGWPFTVVALEPPSVVRVSTVPDTGDDELTSMETATVPVTELVVEFNEPLFDPPGDADPADATNPANYQLVASGPDGTFATPDCQSLVGDDVRVPIDAVTFDSGTSTASLAINGGQALRDGLFRLAVCSAPGVEDLDGNDLDGNGDFVPGDDFERFFRVRLANLIERPDADFASDLAAYSRLGGVPADFTVDGAVDGSAFPLSGSFRLVNGSGDASLALVQCVPVPVGEDSIVFGGRARIDGTSATATATGLAEAIVGPCLAPSSVLATWPGSPVTGPTASTFRAFSGIVSSPPAGSDAIRLRFAASDSPGQPIDARFDRLQMFVALFADGFETGSTVRWSATSP